MTTEKSVKGSRKTMGLPTLSEDEEIQEREETRRRLRRKSRVQIGPV